MDLSKSLPEVARIVPGNKSNTMTPFVNKCFCFFCLLASSQLIVHSSKVRTPQRHNSESVLYMNDEQKVLGTSSNSTEDLMSESSYQQRQFQQRSSDRSNRSDNRLFPINTYTEPPASLNTSTTSLDAKLVIHNISHAIFKSVVS